MEVVNMLVPILVLMISSTVLSSFVGKKTLSNNRRLFLKCLSKKWGIRVEFVPFQ